MKMPAISQAQILAVIGFIVVQVVLYGVIDSAKSQLILSTAATVIATGIAIADAWRHHGNAIVKAAAIAAPGDTEAELKKANTG